MKDHTYEESETVEPTCTEQGYKLSVCSECKHEEKSDYTPAAGHSYGEWQVTKEATCTEDGTRQRTCEKCNNTYTRSIEALGHNYIDGVCTTCGETETRELLCPYCLTPLDSAGYCSSCNRQMETCPLCGNLKPIGEMCPNCGNVTSCPICGTIIPPGSSCPNCSGMMASCPICGSPIGPDGACSNCGSIIDDLDDF